MLFTWGTDYFWKLKTPSMKLVRKGDGWRLRNWKAVWKIQRLQLWVSSVKRKSTCFEFPVSFFPLFLYLYYMFNPFDFRRTFILLSFITFDPKPGSHPGRSFQTCSEHIASSALTLLCWCKMWACPELTQERFVVFSCDIFLWQS